jgi:hypothetical protein
MFLVSDSGYLGFQVSRVPEFPRFTACVTFQGSHERKVSRRPQKIEGNPFRGRACQTSSPHEEETRRSRRHFRRSRPGPNLKNFFRRR